MVWWRGFCDGQVGLFPWIFVREMGESDVFQVLSAVDFKAQDLVTVIDGTDKQRWCGRRGSQVGVFPASYTDRITPDTFAEGSRRQVHSWSNFSLLVLLERKWKIKIAFCDPISSQRVMRTESHPTPLPKDRVDNFIAEATIPFLYFLTDNGKLKLRFVTPYLFEFPKIGFCELQLPQDIVLSFFAMSYLRWRY